MNEDRPQLILSRLRGLFAVIAEEARANPEFAGKVEATLGIAAGRKPYAPALPASRPKEKSEAHKMLHNITFDPLECHIESALLGGREEEARAFLGKLDRGQLDEVVKAQRLPGAKSLSEKILETDTATAVDAIVGSAAERVRSRLSAAS
jgi:hypothetical protein